MAMRRIEGTTQVSRTCDRCGATYQVSYQVSVTSKTASKDFAKHQKRFEHEVDWHWSAYGHGVVAKAVTETVWFKNAFHLDGAP